MRGGLDQDVVAGRPGQDIALVLDLGEPVAGGIRRF